MQPLRYSLNVTLDGCYDHMAGVVTRELHEHAAQLFTQTDGVIFGRVTYQMMEEAFRVPGSSGVKADWMEPWMLPFAKAINASKKYVVSSTLKEVDWNAELVRGDLKTFVQKLKAQPGKGIFVGGVKLAQTLTELALIDEYQFVVHPRLVGHGPTLFAGLSKHVDLKLVDRHEFTNGSVALRYARQL